MREKITRIVFRKVLVEDFKGQPWKSIIKTYKEQDITGILCVIVSKHAKMEFKFIPCNRSYLEKNLNGSNILEYLKISGENYLVKWILDFGIYEFDGEEFSLKVEDRCQNFFSFKGEDYKIIKNSVGEE